LLSDPIRLDFPAPNITPTIFNLFCIKFLIALHVCGVAADLVCL